MSVQNTIVGPLVEPEDQGGLTYYRCEVCGNEALRQEDVHLDFEECEAK